jgi:hypothetical protein
MCNYQGDNVFKNRRCRVVINTTASAAEHVLAAVHELQ